MRLIPTILSGGAGSRLWPLSRELHPKPFIRMSDGQSLLQKTFLRAANLPEIEEILVVTNRELVFKTKDEFQEINKTGLALSFILEPFARNTAASIIAATLRMAQQYGDEILLLVMPADHLIENQLAFNEAVIQAKTFALNNQLVTFGIQPESPETGYGYIEAKGNEVLRFIEKPCLEKAEEYISSGNFFWNAGMFCFKAKTLLEEVEKYCPEIFISMQNCMMHSPSMQGKGFNQLELEAKTFASVPENSIDYALIEKSNRVAVVPCNIGWSDVGCWRSLAELVASDNNGNRVQGEAVLHEVSNCYIHGQKRLVAAVGVKDLFIIDTPDALLVGDSARAQDVKSIYAQLKKQAHETHKLHRTVHRPWGSYTILEEGKNFKIKQIVVKPGAILSLQLHYHRSEHWIVVSGMAKVVIDAQESYIATNESTYVPAGCKHRLENPGVTDLVMIEVQCGNYLGEDDIVRLEDIYGRV